MTPFHLAVGASNFEAISWLLENIKEWNIADATGTTPSMVAILLDNISVLNMLSPHINWNMLASKELHIHWAAQCQSLSSLEFLKSQGFDLDLPNKNGDTPALMAMKQRKTKAVTYLINQNIDLNRADENGKTLMHYAANKLIAEIGIKENIETIIPASSTVKIQKILQSNIPIEENGRMDLVSGLQP